MKRWGGQIWEGRTLPAKGPDIIYLVLVKKRSWNRGTGKQGVHIVLTCSCMSSVLRELPQMARFGFSARRHMWFQRWAQKTRASRVNSTPPEFVPRQGVLSRKPSICFPLPEELLTMSSLLLKHPCVAVTEEAEWSEMSPAEQEDTSKADSRDSHTPESEF